MPLTSLQNGGYSGKSNLVQTMKLYPLILLYLLSDLSFSVLAFQPFFGKRINGGQLNHRPYYLQMSAAEVHEVKLNPERTAIVLIEYQNEFTTVGGKLHEPVKEVMEKTNMLENSKKVADAARDSGCLVVHCPIEFDKVRGLYY